MGRYYSGDIEGKFWFAVQDSNCADRFGSEGYQPEYLEYYFDDEQLPDVEAEIKRIEDAIDVDKVKACFEGTDFYNKEWLKKHSVTDHEVSEYADLLMGRRIRDCIKEEGQCSFTAEL
tara:strand:- start:549 stop:902 length:354 start_codon:yes stop_codon:yes gene_type:complete